MTIAVLRAGYCNSVPVFFKRGHTAELSFEPSLWQLFQVSPSPILFPPSYPEVTTQHSVRE